MDYKIIIRTCAGREQYAQYLIDHIPGIVVVCDRDHNAMHTFLDALDVAGTGAAVHIEDDIILTTNFIDKLHTTISKRPDVINQFFSMRKADIEVGSRWDTGSRFIALLCAYFPPGYSKAIREFYSGWPRKIEHPTGCDTLVADWLKSRRERYWIHVPSLVEHRKIKSAIDPRRSMYRQSRTFEP